MTARKRKARRLKIDIARDGSLVLFTPRDAGAREWLEENVHSEPWQWQGGTLVVDGRMATPIIEAIES